MAEWEYVREYFEREEKTTVSELKFKDDNDFREDLKAYHGGYQLEILKLISVSLWVIENISYWKYKYKMSPSCGRNFILWYLMLLFYPIFK